MHLSSLKLAYASNKQFSASAIAFRFNSKSHATASRFAYPARAQNVKIIFVLSPKSDQIRHDGAGTELASTAQPTAARRDPAWAQIPIWRCYS